MLLYFLKIWKNNHVDTNKNIYPNGNKYNLHDQNDTINLYQHNNNDNKTNETHADDMKKKKGHIK